MEPGAQELTCCLASSFGGGFGVDGDVDECAACESVAGIEGGFIAHARECAESIDACTNVGLFDPVDEFVERCFEEVEDGVGIAVFLEEFDEDEVLDPRGSFVEWSCHGVVLVMRWWWGQVACDHELKRTAEMWASKRCAAKWCACAGDCARIRSDVRMCVVAGVGGVKKKRRGSWDPRRSSRVGNVRIG